MVKATLQRNMIDLIKSFIDSKFLSYECGISANRVYGNLRINTDRGAVEISNIERAMTFFDVVEDVASFACKPSKTEEAFKPYCTVIPQKIEVGEIIKSIEIVNDYINVNHGEYEISFDQAIVIKTENRTIMFSKEIWFSETIAISEHDDYDAVFPISEVAYSFSNYGDYEVDVKRTKRVL